MTNPAQPQSFEEFWPFYVREHSNKANRLIHVAGTTVALAIVAYAAVKRKPKALLLAPLVGYGFAWFGHFFVQKNMPATFKHPLWSFRGDMRMVAKTLAGTMDEEVRRVLEEYAANATGATGATEQDEPAAQSAAPAPQSTSSSGGLN